MNFVEFFIILVFFYLVEDLLVSEIRSHELQFWDKLLIRWLFFFFQKIRAVATSSVFQDI